ncbi:hypothetical protein L6452_32691 [Arctium lappa]|uniref:Uncharacterized protein n=1 Tax=Arctium lappa TaxID=4217 RepID=A0ACB8Z5X9_ARCLA|nr:hypothetical protein L6452_32691 [Arctium lappa]
MVMHTCRADSGPVWYDLPTVPLRSQKVWHGKENEEKLSTRTAPHFGQARSTEAAARARLHRLPPSRHERKTQILTPTKMFDLRPKRFATRGLLTGSPILALLSLKHA